MCNMPQKGKTVVEQNNGIMVSICCLVYNHEKYLRECLESFVRQKTSFKFEVLIHDDASTDASPEIIREYEKRYPDIIKPIYQRENQYSKGVKIGLEYQYPRAKGKYLAFCEGDDFWCDENKLQIQYDIMENNPKCSLCVHPSYLVGPDSGRIGVVKMDEGSYVFSVSDFMKRKFFQGDTGFQTSSYFARKVFVDKLVRSRPDFVMNCPVGDLPLVLYLGCEGDIYYCDRMMSSYRVNQINSWSANMSKDTQRSISYNLKMIDVFRDYDVYTQRKYKHLIMSIIDVYQYKICCYKRDYRSAVKYRMPFKYEPNKRKIYLLLMAYAPWSVKVIQKIRRMF